MKEVIKWQDSPVDVQARLVPRFLWTTASIDVFLGGQCILRTGGQLRFVGSHSATFTHSGSTHTAELNWGASALRPSFPYQLRIDGAPILDSRVSIQNWPVVLIAMVLLGAGLGVVIHFLRHHLRG